MYTNPIVKTELTEQLMGRVTQKIKVTETGCWIFQGKASNRNGYKVIGFQSENMKKAMYLVHRITYVYFREEIPEGLVLDHLECQTKTCVNPNHLEPVTLEENSRRSATGRLKEFCKNGHRFTRGNTYLRLEKGKNYFARSCKACQKSRDAKTKNR